MALRTRIAYSELYPDWEEIETYPVVVNSAGSVLESPSMGTGHLTCPDPYYEWTERYKITHSMCAGDIDPTTAEIEIAFSTDSRYTCMVEDSGHSYGSKSVLTLTRIVSFDSSELVWVRDNPATYENLLRYPDVSGYLFAMLGDTLIHFRGSDGAELQRSDPLASGTKFWAYPLPDSIPRLVNYAGNQVTLYRLDPATSINEDPELPLPTTLTLGHPYPNPFDSTTTVPLSFTRRSLVTVESFNLLGQKVAVIHEEAMPAGDHTLSWDASGLSSGIYFIRATTEFGERTVKALML